MRIIAGEFRSRRLHSPSGLHIRPTSDRLRETLFNVVSGGDRPLAGRVWLDLFAGTGAVGIEALSRGAAMVYFVEPARQAAEVIRRNLVALGITGRFEILEQVAREAIRALKRRTVEPDFIFLDPPYAQHAAYRETLEALRKSSLMAQALVIAEHEKRFDPGDEFPGIRRIRRLEQGDAVLSFYRRAECAE